MKMIFLLPLCLLFLGCTNQEKSTQNTPAKEAEKKAIVEEKALEPVVSEPAKAEVKVVQEQQVEVAVEDEKKTLKKLEAKVKDKLTRLKDKVVAVVPNDIDEVEIYNGRCAACHGHNAEKSALGKSQIIRGWTAKKIEETLHGYKNGTYGGVLKAMMQSQASKLTDEETKALSKYISNL